MSLEGALLPTTAISSLILFPLLAITTEGFGSVDIMMDVRFEPKNSTVTWTLTLPDDDVVEDDDETFTVELSNEIEATLGSLTRAEVRIEDNESKETYDLCYTLFQKKVVWL